MFVLHRKAKGTENICLVAARSFILAIRLSNSVPDGDAAVAVY